MRSSFSSWRRSSPGAQRLVHGKIIYEHNLRMDRIWTALVRSWLDMGLKRRLSVAVRFSASSSRVTASSGGVSRD